MNLTRSSFIRISLLRKTYEIYRVTRAKCITHVICNYKWTFFLSKRNVSGETMGNIMPPFQTQFSLKREYIDSYPFGYLYQFVHPDATKNSYQIRKLFGELYAWLNQFLNVTIIPVCTGNANRKVNCTHRSTIINCRYYFSDKNVLWWW